MGLQGVREGWKSFQGSRTYAVLSLVLGSTIARLFLFPVLVCPLLAIDGAGETKWKTAWVAIVMAYFWITESIPIPVTAFFPLIFFPLFEVVPAKVVAATYMNDTLFILIGSFIVALAMERWGLHVRLALRVVLLMGQSPRRLMAGFMSLTAFISMWINNTATTSLMAPIALAVLNQINEEVRNEDVEQGDHDDTSHITLANESDHEDEATSESETESLKKGAGKLLKDRNSETVALPSTQISSVQDDELPEKHSADHSSLEDVPEEDDPFASDFVEKGEEDEKKRIMELFVKAILLSVAYSASIGGTSTLVGTAPNLVLVNQFSALFPNAPPISFFKWFLFATPLAFIFLLLMWLYLCFFYCPKPHLINIHLDKVKHRYQSLGPMAWPEIIVLIDFGVLVLLWLTRTGIDEFEIPGWGELFPDEYITDGTVAMLCAVVLFFIPSRVEPGQRMMDWESTASLPWGIVMLMGGGFALAQGFLSSGLSEYLGQKLEVLDKLHVVFLLFFVCSSLTLLTELTSNVATANIVLPVLASISVAIKQSPLLLMIPGTISCSYAFMLPVATPPNAVIFAYGHFKVLDMVKAGFAASCMGVVILVSAAMLLAPLIFDIDFGKPPSWAEPSRV